MIHAAGHGRARTPRALHPRHGRRARGALEAGAPILCDVRMVSEGITRARLPADNEVICTLPTRPCRRLPPGSATTRSAAAMELWRAASRRRRGRHRQRAHRAVPPARHAGSPACPRPAAIIGCPVGFVGAAESKDALMAAPPAPSADRAGPARRQRDHGGRGQRAREPEGMTMGTHHLRRPRPRRPGPDERQGRPADARRRHVAYFRKAGRAGQARRIVEGMLRPRARPNRDGISGDDRIPFDSPAYIDCLARFYDDWADRLARLAGAEDVVVLCEGDPFFYGSFMHLTSACTAASRSRWSPASPAWPAAGPPPDMPITWGDDVLTVLMGTLPEDDLVRHMAAADALVVMKTGRNLPRCAARWRRAGRLDARLAGRTRHHAGPAGGAAGRVERRRLPLFRDRPRPRPGPPPGAAGMTRLR